MIDGVYKINTISSYSPLLQAIHQQQDFLVHFKNMSFRFPKWLNMLDSKRKVLRVRERVGERDWQAIPSHFTPTFTNFNHLQHHHLLRLPTEATFWHNFLLSFLSLSLSQSLRLKLDRVRWRLRERVKERELVTSSPVTGTKLKEPVIGSLTVETRDTLSFDWHVWNQRTSAWILWKKVCNAGLI